MPAQSNQLVSFQDLQDLIDNEGFVQNNPFTTSNLLADKLEVEDALIVLTINIADNQLVQRSLILKGGTPVDNPPTAPTSVVVDSFDKTTVTISWSGATDDFGIDFYNMYILAEAGIPIFVEKIAGTFSTYTYTGLAPNTIYRFFIKAIDTIGQESPFSPYAEQTTAPMEPTLNYIDSTQTTIDIMWSSGSTPVISYSLDYRIVGSEIWTSITSIAGLNYTILNLVIATQYEIRVRSIYSGYNSDWSNIVTGFTKSTSPDTEPPTAPTQFDSIIVTEDTIFATWSGATDNVGVIGYNVYISSTFFGFVNIAENLWDVVPGSSYTYGLRNGTTYTIEVESVDAAGNISLTRLISSIVGATMIHTNWYKVDQVPVGASGDAYRCIDSPQFTFEAAGGDSWVWKSGSLIIGTNQTLIQNPTRSQNYHCEVTTGGNTVIYDWFLTIVNC